MPEAWKRTGIQAASWQTRTTQGTGVWQRGGTQLSSTWLQVPTADPLQSLIQANGSSLVAQQEPHMHDAKAVVRQMQERQKLICSPLLGHNRPLTHSTLQ